MIPRTPVNEDARFAGVIYVVEHDHAIQYAGDCFGAARSVLRGSQHICVWRNGLWIGEVNSNGAWTFKTKHFPKPEQV